MVILKLKSYLLTVIIIFSCIIVMYIMAADHIIICKEKTESENLFPNTKPIIGPANIVITSTTNNPI